MTAIVRRQVVAEHQKKYGFLDPISILTLLSYLFEILSYIFQAYGLS